ncbi:KamA family radical SAM protein [candidate division CSSED10-310 bacterium]|uniref:KamA family radical SAM protein n=1 Tax=candidate division CSSED10-310 bacterium TaxID=2855610 RepID=A0ABV6YYK5_UNCC1
MERWIQEDKDAIRNPSDLARYIPLNEEEQDIIEKLCQFFQLKIPLYYLNLINPDVPDDPIRKMCIPSCEEFIVKKGELNDPIGDLKVDLNNQALPAITHRYSDRVLLHLTPLCGGYCRFCFRRRLVGNNEFRVTDQQLEQALFYIRGKDTIREVILTGGDPLMMSDTKLFPILKKLREIPHLWTIRIHTRMPIWNPYRITDQLVAGLKKFQPLWIVAHFNHPREVTSLTQRQLSKLIDVGIGVLNQSVLLKGINDTPEIQRELQWKLIRTRIVPYYMHHVDKAKGISHFRVSIKKGLKIFKELQGTIPGYALPKYVLDIPGGHGKVPLQYNYLSRNGDRQIYIESPLHGYHVYEDAPDEFTDPGSASAQQTSCPASE